MFETQVANDRDSLKEIDGLGSEGIPCNDFQQFIKSSKFVDRLPSYLKVCFIIYSTTALEGVLTREF